MKRLFHPKFRYPKILFLIFMIILAYVLFQNTSIGSWIYHLGKLSYLGTFISGLLFGFGFTCPFAIGYFVTLDPVNIWLHGIIGGLGAVTSTFVVFHLVRFSLMEEFERMEKNRYFIFAEQKIEKTISPRLEHYLLYALAGIVISSPIPDEVAVTMLAGFTHIKPFPLAIFCFVFSTLGISIFLMI